MVNFTEANHIDDAIVVTVWGALLLYGLVANCLIQIGIYRNPTMRTSTSYWFIVSLGFCDIFMILISLLHIIPATVLHDTYITVKSLRNIWAIFFYDIFWYTGVLTLGLMAVNRFVSIVYPMKYQRLFSRDNTTQVIITLFSVGLSVSIPTLFSCCHTVYNHEYYVTTYDPEHSWYFIVDLVVNAFTVVLMLFCYSVILVKVRHSSQAMIRHRLNARTRRKSLAAARKANGSNVNGSTASSSAAPKLRITSPDVRQTAQGTTLSRREMRLFLQFFFVSLVFLLTWSTWQWLPRVAASKWVYFTMTSFFFINNAINPTVYFIFNSTLRREVRTVLKIDKSRTTQIKTSNSGSKDPLQKDGPALRPSVREKFPSCAGDIGRLKQQQYGSGSFRSERIPSRTPSVRKLGVYSSEAAQCLISSDVGTPHGLHNRTDEEMSPISSRDFGSPDALLGDSLREFLSPETLKDDSSLLNSAKLSKEVSAPLLDVSKTIAAHREDLNDSLDNLLSPIPIDSHDEALKLNNDPAIQSICAMGNPVYTASPKAKIIQVSTKPQDRTTEVTINLIAPIEDTNYNEEGPKELQKQGSPECPWVEEGSEANGCSLKAPLVSVTPMDDWNEHVTVELVPVYSPDEELFIYTSTV